jgi:glyoxalase family protein
VLSFSDRDGLALELITSNSDDRPGWADGPVPSEYAIRGFHAPALYVADLVPSAGVLVEVMGFRLLKEEEGRARFATGEGRPGEIVDLVARPDLQAVQAVGTVHHIAWRTPSDAEELAWQAELPRHGLHVTDVRDRQYFHSIYYREPGHILYEIATDVPGFTVDEQPAKLGTSLKLPPFLEQFRPRIEASLPPIELPAGSV